MPQHLDEAFHQVLNTRAGAKLWEIVPVQGGIGPAPGIAERFDLRRAVRPRLLSEQNIIVTVGIEGRV